MIRDYRLGADSKEFAPNFIGGDVVGSVRQDEEEIPVEVEEG